MKYDEALSLWGATKLGNTYSVSGWGQFENVTTKIETLEGNSCCGCGGEYPCRDDIDAETNIVISAVGVNRKGEKHLVETRVNINEYTDEFTLENFLKEILEISGGNISS